MEKHNALYHPVHTDAAFMSTVSNQLQRENGMDKRAKPQELQDDTMDGDSGAASTKLLEKVNNGRVYGRVDTTTSATPPPDSFSLNFAQVRVEPKV